MTVQLWTSGGVASHEGRYDDTSYYPKAAGKCANLPRWTTQNGLRGWIEKEYGVENTQMLLAETLLKKSEKEQAEGVLIDLILFSQLCE